MSDKDLLEKVADKPDEKELEITVDNADEIMREPTDEEKAYSDALEDFTHRLMVTEIPESDEYSFNKYSKMISGIKCSLGIINMEEQKISPLPDDFESPFDEITTWTIAVKNCVELSKLDEEISRPDDNLYIIFTACGRAIVCCDEFWDSICEKYNVMRMFVSLYYKPEDDEPMIVTSLIEDDEQMSAKSALRTANDNTEYRTSFVYVKGVGMLSEAALNSEE